MKTRFYFSLILVSLLAGACTKTTLPDPTPNPNPTPATEKSYNKTIDSYLSTYYLWNEDYNALHRDLTLDYVDDNDNFLTHTLLSLTTNTLDKKPDGQGGYRIYSNIIRTDKSPTRQTTRGVDHPFITKDQITGYGFINFAAAWFDEARTHICFIVDAVYPDSPAEKAGIKRGTVFTQIGGKYLTEDNYQDIFSDIINTPQNGEKTDFLEYDLKSGITTKISLTAEQIYENPVNHSEIFTTGANKIGYLVYTGFDAAYDDDLLTAIQNFRNKEITDLILDLRVNLGGHLLSSNMLSTCIAGTAADGKVFLYYRYNDDRMTDSAGTARYTGNTYDAQKQLFFEDFGNYSQYGDYGDYDYFGVDLHPYLLNLPRLYVLTSANTASASEALINSLRGIGIPVTLVGEQTNGKNVGMEVDDFNDGNYSYELAPITFQTYNATAVSAASQQGTVPPDGIPVEPQYQIDEFAYAPADFGPQDPLVAKALSLIDPADYAPLPEPTRAAGAPVLGKALPLPADMRRPGGMIVLPRQNAEVQTE